MAIQSPEQTIPTTLLPEDQLILDEAFPTLQHLRDSEQIISARLPADAPVFPGKSVNLSPYYMNRGDPPELGVWKITVEDTMQARLQTVPKLNSAREYSLTLKGEDSIARTATTEEMHQLAVLLGFIHENS